MKKLLLVVLLLPGFMLAALEFSNPKLCCDAISEWFSGQAGAIGPDNQLYAAWRHSGLGSGDGGIYFARSLDTNQTWSSDITIHFWDPTWIHAEYSGPHLVPDGDSLYCLYWVRPEHGNNEYHLYCSRSDDLGASWNIFEASISAGASGQTNGFDYAVGDDGGINVVFSTQPALLDWPRAYFTRSTDGGISFTNPVMLPSDTAEYGVQRPSVLALPGGRVLAAFYRSGRGVDAGVVLYSTTDNGSTWDTLALYSQLGISLYPTLRPGRYGDLHLFFEDDNDALKYSGSTDGGATWSAPFTVVSDNFSWGASAGGDRLIVVWNDGSSWDPWFRASEDGGATWGSATRTWSSHPLPGDWLAYDVNVRNDIVTLTFHNEPGNNEGVWCANAEWLTGISGPQPVPEPARNALVARPNPFRGSTVLRAPAGRELPGRVLIIDAAGRAVTELAPGPAATWDGTNRGGSRMPAGVYWARVPGLAPARLVLAD